MARGYIANEKKVIKYLSLCFMSWALAGIPYVMFSANTNWRFLGMAVCVVLGVGAAVLGMFAEQDEYKILKEEPLLFDYEFLKELTNEYRLVKKKYQLIAVPCTILFVVGILAVAVTVKGYIDWTEYHSFVFLGFAVGIFGFIWSIGTIDIYELLVNNEQYCSRLLFKIKRKAKSKIESL